MGPTPAGRGFWREFSVALVFAGLAMMCLQFVLTARFRWLKAPYGSDIVYYFCGPQPMMDAVERALLSLGVAAGDIHTERFDLV